MKFNRQDIILKDGRKLYVYNFHNHSQQQKSLWNKVADQWKQNAQQIEQWMQPVTDLITKRIQNGIVVDLGCGAATIPIQNHVKVIGIDIAPKMLQTGMMAIAATLEQIPLQNNTCDAAISRMAFMLTQNPQQAFKETHRILKDNAIFSFAVWQSQRRNTWVQIPQKIILHILGIPLPQSDQPSAFRLSNRAEVRTLLKHAGFKNIKKTQTALPFFRQIGPFETWQFVKHHIAPIAAAFDKLTEQQQKQAQKEILNAYQKADLNAHADVWYAQK